MSIGKIQPLTRVDIERELWRLSNLLEESTEKYAVLARDAALAESEHKSEFAKMLLQADGRTASEREAIATVATETGMKRRKIAEALAGACLEQCRSLRAQLSAVQSLSANVRAQT